MCGLERGWYHSEPRLIASREEARKSIKTIELGSLVTAALVHFQLANVPVFVMLRPHSKMSYCFTDIDMECITNDMRTFRENGADGFVFGALVGREIDFEKCRIIADHAHGLPLTFHRAFDMSIPSKQFENLRKISECGYQRVLTSGFAKTAEDGIEVLKNLNEYAIQNQLASIMPGCGVNVLNAERILRETGCKEYHGSAKMQKVLDIPATDSDTFAISEEIRKASFSVTEKRTVAELVAVGKRFL